MLSIQKCRDLLPKSCLLNEQEIERLRDSLYKIAEVVVSACVGSNSNIEKSRNDNESFSDDLKLLPPSERDEVEERASIMQFEGKLPRKMAERAALNNFQKRHKHPHTKKGNQKCEQ